MKLPFSTYAFSRMCSAPHWCFSHSLLDVLVPLVPSASPGRVREFRAARPEFCELDDDVPVKGASGPSNNDVEVEIRLVVVAAGSEKSIACQSS